MIENRNFNRREVLHINRWRHMYPVLVPEDSKSSRGGISVMRSSWVP